RILDDVEYAGREASALYMLGAVFLDLGQPNTAREAFTRARDFGQNAGNQRAVLLSEAGIAYLDLLAGQAPDAAQRAATASLEFVQNLTARTNLSGRTLVDRELDALLATAAGRIFFRLGDIEAAYQAFEKGFEAFTALEDGARGAIENAVWLEQSALRLGRRTEARRVIEAGRGIQRAARSTRLQIAFLAWMGVVYGETGDLKKAVELQREALSALRQSPDRALEIGLQWNLANTQAALRNYTDARQSYEAVLQLCEKDADPFWRDQVRSALVRLP
ncbi:MAG: tetratricopeptide repeat protein, partial [Chloracidobacterium sp.]